MTMICVKSARQFFGRRLARIVPLYWLITGVVFLLSWFKPQLMNSTTPSAVNLVRSLFFVPYVKENGEVHPMLDVGWTLNYEMYFYAAIALALLVVPTRLATIAPADSYPAMLAWFYSRFYVLEFVLGVAVFYLVQHPLARKPGVIVNLVLAAVCLVFLAYNHFRHPLGHAVPGLTQGVPAMLFVAAMLLLEQKNFVFTKITILGDASYALYLTNQFVVEGFRKIASKALHFPFYSVPSIALVIVLASAAAIVIYIALEKPLHDRLRILVDGKPAPR
jgi:peptidoglycan/LPS O-acetylase OafA/YrhL